MLPLLCSLWHLPSSASDRFVVQVHESIEQFQENANEVASLDQAERRRCFDREVMTGKNGRRFTCFVPNANSLAERPANKTSSDGSASKVIEQLRAAHGDECLQFPEGYWTYEVCPMRSVNQFHMEGKKRTTVFELGHYVQKKDEWKHKGEDQQYIQRFSGGTGGRKAAVRYSCGGQKPKVASVREDPKHSYTIHVQSPLLCKHANASALLAPYQGQCVRKKKGWWTHEICFGKKVRQFHKDQKGKVDQEYIVGRFDAAATAQLEAEGQAIQEEVLMEETGVEQQKAVYMQHYTGGDLCDVTKKPRRVVVWHYCASDHFGLAITSVEETNTCQYTLAVAVPALCKHPRLKQDNDGAHAEGSTQTIHCVPGAKAAL